MSLNIEGVEENENKKPPENENTTRYKSQSGFVEVKVVRGFTEIADVAMDIWGQNGTICGGYVRYMCSPLDDPVSASDLDVYCKSEEIYNKLKNLLGNIRRLSVRHENEISLTFSKVTNYEHEYFGSPPIQLIKPLKEGRVVTNGTMEEVLSNFDFTVIRAGLLTEKSALVDADFLHDEKHKFLRLKNIHCPISSTLRCCKYSRKGYWLSPYNAYTLFADWESRDDIYREKIAEFLRKSLEGEGGELTKEEIDKLEKMMRID